MDREVKFRAWDGKRMLYMGKGGFCDFELSGGDIYVIGMFDAKKVDYPLMQYAGLKDKNGLEIYESDLIELHGNKNGCVKVMFKNAYVGGWVLTECYAGEENYISLGARESSDLEVIGNIYETPELLNKGN